VSALETKNELTETENEHLRELLQRLQDENKALKQEQQQRQQAGFTFSMPRQSNGDSQSFKNLATTSFGISKDNGPVGSSYSKPSSFDAPSTFPSDIDFGSLAPLGSAMNVSEDGQLSDLDSSMVFDFGSGYGSSKTPYKTIVANPMFMSFADPSPIMSTFTPSDKSDALSPGRNPNSPFDLPSSLSVWSGSSTSDANNGSSRTDAFDELFGASPLSSQGMVNFNVLTTSPSSISRRDPHTSSSSSSQVPTHYLPRKVVIRRQTRMVSSLVPSLEQR